MHNLTTIDYFVLNPKFKKLMFVSYSESKILIFSFGKNANFIEEHALVHEDDCVYIYERMLDLFGLYRGEKLT